MAKVTLYFEPYTEDDADGLRIQESADGLTGWTTIEDVGSGSIGTYPEYISSYTTSAATSTQYWFRISWLVGGAPQGFSEPAQVGDLPPRYTSSDIIQSETQFAALQVASDLYVFQLIDMAYFMLQDECGPFDETNPEFIERAPLAMLRLVEYLFVRLDPALASASAGIIEEKIGSYRYRLAEQSAQLVGELEVPAHIAKMICSYSLADEGEVEMVTTHVFEGTTWRSADEKDVDRLHVYVSGDADRTAPVPQKKWGPD